MSADPTPNGIEDDTLSHDYCYGKLTRKQHSLNPLQSFWQDWLDLVTRRMAEETERQIMNLPTGDSR